jgi:mono/diheme cytochrome c family protein
MAFLNSWRLLALVLGAVSPAFSAETFSPEQISFFETKIRPVLAESCYECHGAKKAMNGLRLDSRAAILKGGDYGQVVQAGNPDASKLIHAIRHDRPQAAEPMPKGQPKLTDAQIGDFTEWVRQQLPWPPEAGPAAAALPSAKDHWAFKPVQRPPLPAVQSKDQVYQPMDAFVLHQLESNGLSLSPKVDRAARMRRLQIDLLGFPPSFEEVQAFTNDQEPNAYIRLVDRLLASPHFGERWARYWLDLSRYADTKGYVFQEERKYPFAYTYRDWVIRALNADMPYDEFIKHQLSADLINPAEQPENLAALGFLTLGRRFLNNEADIIDDRLDVIFRGLQGLTVACARCHDHKFDPIPTADYYSLYGVLASSTEPKDLPLIGELERTPEVIAYEKQLAEKVAKIDDYRKERFAAIFQPEMLEKYLLATVPVLDKPEKEIHNLARDRGLYGNILQRWITLVQKGPEAVFGVWKQLQLTPDGEFEAKAKALLEAPDAVQKFSPELLQAIKQSPPKSVAELAKVHAKVFAEASPLIATTKPAQEPIKQALSAPEGPMSVKPDELDRFFTKSEQNKFREIRKQIDNFKATNPAAPARAMAMVDKPQPVEPKVFIRGNPGRQGEKVPRQFLHVLSGPERKPFTQGSGRREMAEMIASKSNPLTARVFVNRVWGHLFGNPLVDTPSDYGVRTAAPVQAALLDHLASQFIDQDWSVKKLIREIALSATYQQQSLFRPEAAAKDPDNHLVWRMNRKRMDFEALRDSLLVVSGNADLTQFGKAVELFVPPFSKRRTLYGFIDRQNLPGTFRTFDFASPDSHAPQRFETTVPQQALYLLNSPFVQEQAAKLLAATSSISSPEEKVRTLIRQVLSRDATDSEIQRGVAFIQSPLGSPQTGRAWSYGYGGWDAATNRLQFTPFPHFESNRWSGSAKNPDPQLGYTQVAAKHGHPGANPQLAAIRQWHAAETKTIHVQGIVDLPSKDSRGIKAQIISSRTGIIQEWIVNPASKVPAEIPGLAVEAGETLSFVIDCHGDDTCDSYHWAPKIVDASSGNVIAHAEDEFSGPATPPWQALAQAILCANEFVFID